MNTTTDLRALPASVLLCRWVGTDELHYGLNMRNQYIAAILTICWCQLVSLKAVELPQNVSHLWAVGKNNPALIGNVSSNVPVIGHRIALSVEMTPPSGQLPPEMIQSGQLLPLHGERVRDQDAHKTASEEGDCDGYPISCGGWTWHDVKYVLVQAAFVLMCWSSLALGAWLGYLLVESANYGLIASWIRRVSSRFRHNDRILPPAEGGATNTKDHD